MTIPPELDPVARRLRGHLRREADGVSTADPTGWDDVSQRIVRDGARRRRVLATALAVTLVAGPTAGFVVGRAGGGDDGTPVRSAANERSRDAGAGASPLGPGIEGSFGADGVADRAMGYGWGWPGSLEHRDTRVTDAGVTVRVYLAPGPTEPGAWGPEGWTPPPHCYPAREVVVGMSTEAAVGVGHGGLYDALAEPIVHTSGVFGVAEGDAHAWVVAQVEGAAVVRVELAGGGTDEVEPVSGVAVLAAPIELADNNDWTVTGTLSALDGSGAVLASADLAAPRIEVRDECQPPPPPPPSLPEPGEQPSDPDAARDAVTEAFEVAFDGSLEPDERAPFVEGGEVVAWEAVLSGSFEDQVRNARARVSELVFTSPTEATVLYDIVITDWTDFHNRLGQARLVDGSWVVTRETICTDLALAGVTCE